jgi:signal peptidase I
VNQKKSTIREYFESIVIAVVLALFVRTFVFQAYKIPTGSMENNLLIGDHLLVNKFVYGTAGPEKSLLPMDDIHRGDVIVFKFPEDPSRDFIKRVIGLPGETLEVRQKKVYIDGKPIDEPYVHYLAASALPEEFREVTSAQVKDNYGPVTVPPNEYFMMGDNRDNSLDSRWWGFLKRDYMKGKALFIYWSYESGLQGYEEPGLAATLKRLGSVFIHFFTQTRWSRMFDQIH